MNSSRKGLNSRLPRFSATAGSRFRMVASREWCSVKCLTRVASLTWRWVEFCLIRRQQFYQNNINSSIQTFWRIC